MSQVYERLDWRDVIISRATRAVCGKTQTPRSFTPDEGASLALELKESEREGNTNMDKSDKSNILKSFGQVLKVTAQ